MFSSKIASVRRLLSLASEVDEMKEAQVARDNRAASAGAWKIVAGIGLAYVAGIGAIALMKRLDRMETRTARIENELQEVSAKKEVEKA